MPFSIRAWQLKRIAAGLCQQCGQPRDVYKSLCNRCGIRRQEWTRWDRGYQRRFRTYLTGRKRREVKAA